MDDARDPRLAGWSDRLYRTLVERIPAVVYIDSSDQRPDSLYISPQVQELLQSPPDAYVADPELWRRQTHPDDVERIAETWRQARIHERAFELRVPDDPGRRRCDLGPRRRRPAT